MKIGDVYYEKHTVTEISRRTNTVSETQVERVNAIPIPDNATNGDMIKMMFPHIEAETYGLITNVKWLDCDKGSLDQGRKFWSEWWNAKYKAESEANDV